MTNSHNEIDDTEADDFEDELENNIDDLIAADTEDQVDIVAPSKQGNAEAIPKEQRMTTSIMTRFEKARILGTRALQISMGAPVMVELEGETDSLQIAIKELKAKVVPLDIRRYLPDGSYETWKVSEFEIPEL